PRCHPVVPESVLEIHGTDDRIVPYGGGRVQGRGGGQVLGAPATAALWRGTDTCSTQVTNTAMPDRVNDGTHISVNASTGCARGTEVILDTIQGGGHTWPGTDQNLVFLTDGNISHQFDAGE